MVYALGFAGHGRSPVRPLLHGIASGSPGLAELVSAVALARRPTASWGSPIGRQISKEDRSAAEVINPLASRRSPRAGFGPLAIVCDSRSLAKGSLGCSSRAGTRVGTESERSYPLRREVEGFDRTLKSEAGPYNVI
jgi:hypothetical protein